jgi:fermentation-respiration switch protein FrsA (DUF1100 family)
MSIIAKITAALTAATALSAAALAGEVRTERVTFTSGGETIAGTLYIPEGVDAANPAAGVVVTGAWMTIKEQMAGHYARAMAERGTVALAFDFRTRGESGGRQRSMEAPRMKIEDIKAAAAFLDSRAETADGQIAGLGICASAGYMAAAVAAEDTTLKSVALVAPWLHDAAIVAEVYGGAEGVAALIEAGHAAQAKYEATSEITLLPAAGPEGSNAVMAGVPYYTEADRGLIPAWENTFNVASWEPWLTFDGIAPAPSITAPVLIVHSEAAAIPHGAKRFFEKLEGEKSELWLDGVSQLDFYGREAPVTAAADAVAAHFANSL